MKLTLGEMLFVGIPTCIVLLIVTDATYLWTWQKWTTMSYEFISGYFTWVIWENRHVFRNPHGHTN